MHIKKIIKKQENLEKIFKKANSEKNILLITILKLNNQLSFFARNAFFNKESIQKISDLYNIDNEFVKRRKNNLFFWNKKMNKQRELWIYLKEKQKYNVDSYSRYEKIILENIKTKNIDFIALNNEAKLFLEKNNLNILKIFETSDKNLSVFLTTTIKYLYLKNNYSKVNFILNSNKNHSGYFTILPLEDFDITQFKIEDIRTINKKISDYSIYPNVNTFIKNSIDTYIKNSINSLIIESKFYDAKNNLVKYNKIIKELEQKLFLIKRQIIKIKREKELEEILMITKNNNKLSLYEKGKNDYE
ncbi:MSC_0622 family F1-like ATPase gamma subunit [[Mycoplasma] collis]|uniref:MSC_0622 family F1-like ATPase gamma subunit n=1 Tax=[Mycoplasma] collis TaxID=2127 RepID=UPI00051ADCF2|nr:hypothetical protein [[Mycoplasma] collis]